MPCQSQAELSLRFLSATRFFTRSLWHQTGNYFRKSISNQIATLQYNTTKYNVETFIFCKAALQRICIMKKLSANKRETWTSSSLKGTGLVLDKTVHFVALNLLKHLAWGKLDIHKHNCIFYFLIIIISTDYCWTDRFLFTKLHTFLDYKNSSCLFTLCLSHVFFFSSWLGKACYLQLSLWISLSDLAAWVLTVWIYLIS